MLKTISEENSRLLKISILVMPVLWIAGMVFSVTLGGAIHILPFLSVAGFMMMLSSEEKTRPGDKAPRMKSAKPVRRTS